MSYSMGDNSFCGPQMLSSWTFAALWHRATRRKTIQMCIFLPKTWNLEEREGTICKRGRCTALWSLKGFRCSIFYGKEGGKGCLSCFNSSSSSVTLSVCRYNTQRKKNPFLCSLYLLENVLKTQYFQFTSPSLAFPARLHFHRAILAHQNSKLSDRILNPSLKTHKPAPNTSVGFFCCPFFFLL